jgi:hypothetical protein
MTKNTDMYLEDPDKRRKYEKPVLMLLGPSTATEGKGMYLTYELVMAEGPS